MKTLLYLVIDIVGVIEVFFSHYATSNGGNSLIAIHTQIIQQVNPVVVRRMRASSPIK